MWIVIQTRFYPPSVRLDSKQFKNRLNRAIYVISACSSVFCYPPLFNNAPLRNQLSIQG